MNPTTVRAQLQRTGPLLLVLPVCTGTAVGLAGGFLPESWSDTQVATVTDWLIQFTVLCAGLCVVLAATGDPVVELHESTVTVFRTVQTIRTGAVLVSGVVGAVVAVLLMHSAGREEGTSMVGPVGAVIVAAAAGVVVAAFSRNTSAATIAAVSAWLGLSMLWDPYVLPLPLQRGIPVTGAALALCAAWIRLGDAERNIAKVAAP
ncbi:hypothetical protein [Corynebacterium nuruki]|uniref:hypothetical protein n=1 Tax=Corynebacterium nuruki TaxID=1032851 RepID=UPI0039BFECC1